VRRGTAPIPLIDLHLHTTASDGRCSPEQLVRRAWAVGLTVISVTDHDTTAALDAARQAATPYGIRVVDGIEVTAVLEGSDIHLLGYFIDPATPRFREFLDAQRRARLDRVRAIADRLARLGAPIDIDRITAEAERQRERSVGRPQIAWALVRAGHVSDPKQAFDRLIGEGQPAYVARDGPAPAAAIAAIHDGGGLASLAHPALLHRDDSIAGLVRDGLDAVEVFHSDHTLIDTEKYLALAAAHDLLVTGGSDYHGERTHRAACLGRVGLPPDYFARLEAAVGGRGGAPESAP
jgi:predicted metal-dependent phosphoesterase TrpH